MKPEPNALSDLAAFLTAPIWPTFVYWVLLVLSCGIAFSVWQRVPRQRSVHSIGMWLLRLVVGTMWWQQSLWKIPPNYGGLVYWMNQIVAHSAVRPQAVLVARIVVPNIAVFGPLVYASEALIGASLMAGVFTRVFSALGLLMALNLWVGLYSAPNEWPWTYGYLIVIQALFVLNPPGRQLGLDRFVSDTANAPPRVDLVRKRL